MRRIEGCAKVQRVDFRGHVSFTVAEGSNVVLVAQGSTYEIALTPEEERHIVSALRRAAKRVETATKPDCTPAITDAKGESQ